ncbi:MAG TPA: anaerobic ribonucleoside-triphosphate reductase activating protein [bacterium]|nr:anaerobic ribonucleoside-triphosphate reductase activating protein [bacterium]
MKYSIKGWVKNSFCDWDSKVSSVIFLPRCNMRCPFCQNWELVQNYDGLEDIDWQSIKSYLDENKDFLDGIVITGGEPFVSDFLFELVKEVKTMGLGIKIDTNGTFPEKLKFLIDTKMVDSVAMDVKNALNTEAYSKASGIRITDEILEKIVRSIEILMNSDIDYEFRTTVVRNLHSSEDIKKIAEHLNGAKKFVLQQYRNIGVKKNFDGGKLFSKEELDNLCRDISHFFQQCFVRFYD